MPLDQTAVTPGNADCPPGKLRLRRDKIIVGIFGEEIDRRVEQPAVERNGIWIVNRRPAGRNAGRRFCLGSRRVNPTESEKRTERCQSGEACYSI